MNLAHSLVAIWLSGIALVSINEITLRRAWLVSSWTGDHLRTGNGY